MALLLVLSIQLLLATLPLETFSVIDPDLRVDHLFVREWKFPNTSIYSTALAALVNLSLEDYNGRAPGLEFRLPKYGNVQIIMRQRSPLVFRTGPRKYYIWGLYISMFACYEAFPQADPSPGAQFGLERVGQQLSLIVCL